MPDGNSLILSGFNLPHYFLWRVSANSAGAPERIEMPGAEALWPSISRVGERLAFSRSILQADIFKWEKGGKANAFLSSTARDTSPQFSGDGKRIAFLSARGGGAIDIWVAESDGSRLLQLTRTKSGGKGAPAWAPDNQSIAFVSSIKAGESHVWTMNATGGMQKQLTTEPAGRENATWSRDGKWVYFASDRSGRLELWRVAAQGGPEQQFTSSGAKMGMESADGKTIYYMKSNDGNEGIFARPVAGGQEQLLINDPIVRLSFAVLAEGIYYITPRDENRCDLRLYEFATGQKRFITEIERPVAFGLSVSPDRKTFLFSRHVTGSDLMMVENFR